MIKYYQVFISSVSNGFKEIRTKIIDKMLKQNKFFPIAMELMVSESSTLEMLYNYMKSSDICILLLGDDIGSKIGNALDNISNPDILKAIEIYKTNNNLDDAHKITYTEFEYACAQYLNVAVIPFVKNSVIESCELKTANESLLRFYNTVREKAAYNVWINEPAPDEVVTSLNRHIDLHPELSGWIKENESEIFKSATDAGIVDISLDGFLSRKKLKHWLSDANELKLCYTTGRAFVLNNSDILADFVANGGTIKLLCCKPKSQSMVDIQIIEEKVFGNRENIHNELSDVFNEFKNIYNLAKTKHKYNNYNKIGTIQIGFLSTLLRSSFLIIENYTNEIKKGWFTITLPPAKSRETISFEIISNQNSKIQNNLLNRSYTHFEYVWKHSTNSGNIINIATTNEITKENNNAIMTDDTIAYWKLKEKSAIVNMRKRKRNNNILIEVAAQHPLVDGVYPNEEFLSRLDSSINLYNEKTNQGFNVKIYVPGSIHLDSHGIADEISLSEAGKKYLIENGIPDNDIYGDEKNSLYDKIRYHKGVYNSADECFIASNIFFDEINNFGQLYSICSPNQLMRKTLFYIEFGIIPKIITVPSSDMFHNFFHELFISIPYVLNEDHDYQSKISKEAIRTRKERLPGYIF